MQLEEFIEMLSDRRGSSIDRARDTSLPARYRENFAIRAEVYEEILRDLEQVVTALAAAETS